MIDLPASYAIGLYLLQENTQLSFILTAKTNHTESQTGSLWFIQLEEKIIALNTSECLINVITIYILQTCTVNTWRPLAAASITFLNSLAYVVVVIGGIPITSDARLGLVTYNKVKI